MEVALRRLEGVDKIAISISAQRFQVTYKNGASFRPEQIRAAVARADVAVVRFRVSARGRVQQENGKSFFVAGKDRFSLAPAPKIPAGRPLFIEGAVDDSTAPPRLTVSQFKPIR